MKNLARRLVKRNKGLALSELMVATALLSLLVMTIGNVYINGQQSYYYIQGSAENLQEVRLAADQVSRDVRTTIEIEIGGAQSNLYSFKGDYDGNGTTDTISYAKVTQADGTFTLNRTVNGASKILAKGVVNSGTQPLFNYYDQNGASTTDATQVKLVQLDLRVDKDVKRSPKRSTQIVAKIQLRNLHERR